MSVRHKHHFKVGDVVKVNWRSTRDYTKGDQARVIKVHYPNSPERILSVEWLEPHDRKTCSLFEYKFVPGNGPW